MIFVLFDMFTKVWTCIKEQTIEDNQSCSKKMASAAAATVDPEQQERKCQKNFSHGDPRLDDLFVKLNEDVNGHRRQIEALERVDVISHEDMVSSEQQIDMLEHLLPLIQQKSDAQLFWSNKFT